MRGVFAGKAPGLCRAGVAVRGRTRGGCDDEGMPPEQAGAAPPLPAPGYDREEAQ